jgi:hypothetical protein
MYKYVEGQKVPIPRNILYVYEYKLDVFLLPPCNRK